MIKPVILWTDVLIFLLTAVVVMFIFYARYLLLSQSVLHPHLAGLPPYDLGLQNNVFPTFQPHCPLICGLLILCAAIG